MESDEPYVAAGTDGGPPVIDLPVWAEEISGLVQPPWRAILPRVKAVEATSHPVLPGGGWTGGEGPWDN